MGRIKQYLDNRAERKIEREAKHVATIIAIAVDSNELDAPLYIQTKHPPFILSEDEYLHAVVARTDQKLGQIGMAGLVAYGERATQEQAVALKTDDHNLLPLAPVNSKPVLIFTPVKS